MHVEGYEIWLEIEGQRQTEYEPRTHGIPQNTPNQSNKLVLAEPGKKFVIWGQPHQWTTNAMGPKRVIAGVSIDGATVNITCQSRRQSSWYIQGSDLPGGGPGGATSAAVSPFMFENVVFNSSTHPQRRKEHSIKVTVRPEVQRRQYEGSKIKIGARPSTHTATESGVHAKLQGIPSSHTDGTISHVNQFELSQHDQCVS
ncbi:hypothetical protein CALCODRAFT_500452 [Calocera cornea HHB12733]|uniref:Uncharacterized protein n=1 Tax=Calocera cornea HHB12733 TaxID=1353952 RepID=A0A165E339_9BASI|nr:hypothetical protein CALCODRAFT_500452 [Calocera cornea HHB12733]